MKNIYENIFNLRTSDFDRHCHIHPAAVLDLFQEVAGAHAEEIGAGFVKMLEKKQLWVVVRVKFQVKKEIEYHTPVTVRTWPLEPSRVGFQREYQIIDRFGEVAVDGSSDWVVMHSEERRLMPVSDIYPADMEYHTQRVFEGRSKKLRDFEPNSASRDITTVYSDIDLNGHVNNIRYANFVMDTIDLKEDEAVDSFQLDFHREIKCFDTVTVLTAREGKEIFAKGVNADGEMSFNCKITLR